MKRGTSMSIEIEWTNGQTYVYSGYKSAELAMDHFLGFCGSQVVAKATVVRIEEGPIRRMFKRTVLKEYDKAKIEAAVAARMQ